MKPVKIKLKKKAVNSKFSIKVAAGVKTLLLTSAPTIILMTVLGLFFGGVIATAVNSPAFELQERLRDKENKR